MNIELILESVINYSTYAAYFALFGIIFAESGLLIGFFLPGDSLLFTTGFLASKGLLNIYVLVIVYFLGAVLGDSVGYAFGHKIGKRLFKKEDSIFFHKDNLLKAKTFYEKYGKKTIILARFIPIVRTFAPIVAGIGDMHYITFLTYNIIGGILWAIGLPVAGYFLGSLIPDVDKYLIPIVGIIIVISLIPTVYHLAKNEHSRKGIYKIAKKAARIK